jgi:hypothetical protein
MKSRKFSKFNYLVKQKQIIYSVYLEMHECRFHVLKEFKYKRRSCKKQLELKRKRYLDSAKRKPYQGMYIYIYLFHKKIFFLFLFILLYMNQYGWVCKSTIIVSHHLFYFTLFYISLKCGYIFTNYCHFVNIDFHMQFIYYVTCACTD